MALSSRPLTGLGRIWADGNLLRGAAGDLKAGGTLRFHPGHADQSPDPLLAAALGAQCPAHRGLAYVVFEDLQLADFGNRIPALSFEVFAYGAGPALLETLGKSVPFAEVSADPCSAAGAIDGFSQDGGSLADDLALLAKALPFAVDANEDRVLLRAGADGVGHDLPTPIAWPDGEFGTRTGMQRRTGAFDPANALRYYDSGRDFQPGLQRATGPSPSGGDRTIELPAALSADGARALIDAIRLRGQTVGDRLMIRVAALDPEIGPGALVDAEGERWRVEGWEWREGGVELDLVRHSDVLATSLGADAGTPWQPADRLAAKTRLEAFELPWDGTGAADAARVHVAVGAGTGRWPGAMLYAERAGTLIPIARSGPARAVMGTLGQPLAPSSALIFEPQAALEVICDDPAADFPECDLAALASGANRLLVGGEVVQYAAAEPLGAGLWRLSGLMRGRGASEAEAGEGHAAGTSVIRLDARLTVLDGSAFDPESERIAAIGAGDYEPVFAEVEDPGRSRRPLSPVHPSVSVAAGGEISLGWVRRARGAWAWLDGVDTPLGEETESYEVGAGPAAAPLALWRSAAPALVLAPADLAGLSTGTPLWVRQIGRFAKSPALLLHTLP